MGSVDYSLANTEITNSDARVYLNIIAIVILLGVIVLSRRLRSRGTPGDRIFVVMSLVVILFAMFNVSVSNLTYDFDIDIYFRNTNIMINCMEICTVILSYQWLMYVGYMIYGSRDYLRRRFWPFLIPIPVFVILLIVNIFTGFLFKYDLLLERVYKPSFYIIPITEVLYILFTVVIAVRHNLKADRLQKFHISFVLVPVAIGVFVENIFNLRILPLCLAAALAFIFLSLKEQWQFDDEERGFYNRAYLSYMKELVNLGRKNYSCVLRVTCSGDDAVVAELIRSELPRGIEKVHSKKGVYEIYAEKGSDELLGVIGEALEEGASEYGKEHQGKKLELETETDYRAKGETSAEFLRRIEEKWYSNGRNN